MKKIEIDKSILYDLYVNKKYSSIKCGEIFGCS